MAKKNENHPDQLTLDFTSKREDKPLAEEDQAPSTTKDRPDERAANRVPPDLRFPYEHCLKALTDWSLFPRLLTIQEASWLSQVPIGTLYKWNAEGKLKKVVRVIGKQLRFDREALLRMWIHETTKSTK